MDILALYYISPNCILAHAILSDAILLIETLRDTWPFLTCVFVWQVLGTLLIYVLFMVEEFRKEPVENMDDVIYYVNGTYRLLEFLVALCVVVYGVSETIFGEWTVMGSTIIFIHSYYNVWLRAHLGWQNFLLRRDAVNKIKCLPMATDEQLEKHNDICAICYQVYNMNLQSDTYSIPPLYKAVK